MQNLVYLAQCLSARALGTTEDRGIVRVAGCREAKREEGACTKTKHLDVCEEVRSGY